MATTTDYTAAGAFSYTATESGLLTIVAIGGGGGARGGGAGVLQGAGGAGGGALAGTTISILPGESVTGTVGAGGAGSAYGTNTATDGGATEVYHESNFVVEAVGGTHSTTTAGAAGGQASACTGTTRVNGSNGGGISGGSGGVGGAGGSNTDLTGGAGGTPGGASSLKHGLAPGGGGAGGDNTSGDKGIGGNGATGQVRLIFEPYPDLVYGFYRDDFTVVGASSWRAPATGTVLVQCVGGGAGGMGGQGLSTGGGGAGGGAYSEAVMAVERDDVLSVTVGAAGAGGDWGANNATSATESKVELGSTVLVSADGGARSTSFEGAAGGQAANGVGDICLDGYNGQTRSSVGTFSSGFGGAGAGPFGGDGGLSGGQGLGNPGAIPGGAGSGGGANSGGDGGDGARGEVRISYIMSIGTIVDEEGTPRAVTKLTHVESGVGHDATLSVKNDGVMKQLSVVIPDGNQRRKPKPSYLPSGDEDLFDPDTGAFNWPVGAANFRAALAAGDLSIMSVGDSLTEGFTYLNNLPPFDWTVDRLNSFPFKMRNALGLPVAGTGLVRTVGGGNDSDLRWTFSGGSRAGHVATLSATSHYAEFASELPGTEVAVSVIDSTTGTIRISVDGATSGPGVLQVVGTGLNVVRRHVISGLSDTTHTVRITAPAGTIYVLGAEVTRSTGVRVHNLGQGGATASGSGQASWSDESAGYVNMLPAYKQQTGLLGRPADMVMICLGGNDLKGEPPRDYAAIATAMEHIGEELDGPDTDICLVLEPHGSRTFASPPGYAEESWTRQYDMAVDHGWAVIDAEWLTWGYERLFSRGYVGDTWGHLNTTGAAVFGESLAATMLESKTVL